MLQVQQNKTKKTTCLVLRIGITSIAYVCNKGAQHGRNSAQKYFKALG